MGEDTRQKNKHRKPQIKVARGSLNFHEKQLIHRSSVGFNKRRDVRLQVILGTHFIGRVTDGCGEERRVLTNWCLRLNVSTHFLQLTRQVAHLVLELLLALTSLVASRARQE